MWILIWPTNMIHTSISTSSLLLFVILLWLICYEIVIDFFFSVFSLEILEFPSLIYEPFMSQKYYQNDKLRWELNLKLEWITIVVLFPNSIVWHLVPNRTNEQNVISNDIQLTINWIIEFLHFFFLSRYPLLKKNQMLSHLTNRIEVICLQLTRTNDKHTLSICTQKTQNKLFTFQKFFSSIRNNKLTQRILAYLFSLCLLHFRPKFICKITNKFEARDIFASINSTNAKNLHEWAHRTFFILKRVQVRPIISPTHAHTRMIRDSCKMVRVNFIPCWNH